MKGKIVTALVSIAIMALIGIGTQWGESTQVGTTPIAYPPYKSNIFTFSTISGAGTAVDLGTPICNHNITYYHSGAWLTIPLAPGLQLPIEVSNDNSHFVTLSTYWATTPNSTTGTQISGSNCYKYIRAGWTSMVNAYAWASVGNGRVNVLIMSGGN